MINFIAKFKFLIGFIVAILAALAPSLYNEYKTNRSRDKIYFTYESFEDTGLKILGSKYPHMGSFLSLNDKMINEIDKKFMEKKYTLSSVKKSPKVLIPISIASSFIKQIHLPTISMIKRPYVAKFTINNKSNYSVSINKLVISTDDAYSDPIWDVYYDYPCEKRCNLKKSNSNSTGYMLDFEGEMVLPRKTKFQLYIFFPDLPIIKIDHSFSQVVVQGSNDAVIHLRKEIKVDKLSIYLEFTYKIITLFLVILGLAYLIILVNANMKKK